MLKAKKCKNEAYEEEQDKGYDKLFKAFDHQRDIQPSDAVSYAMMNSYLWGKAPTCGPDFTPEEFHQIKAKRMRYILHLTQEEITILWGLLNDNKGNLCYAQLLAKVEQLRPQGGFYDPHNTQQKRKV